MCLPVMVHAQRILSIWSQNGVMYSDLEKLNEINNLFKCMYFGFVFQLDFDSFINCDSVSCIQQQKELLQERLELGDPVAQYTYSVL